MLISDCGSEAGEDVMEFGAFGEKRTYDGD
jgi:hypothetical protein